MKQYLPISQQSLTWLYNRFQDDVYAQRLFAYIAIVDRHLPFSFIRFQPSIAMPLFAFLTLWLLSCPPSAEFRFRSLYFLLAVPSNLNQVESIHFVFMSSLDSLMSNPVQLFLSQSLWHCILACLLRSESLQVPSASLNLIFDPRSEAEASWSRFRAWRHSRFLYL